MPRFDKQNIASFKPELFILPSKAIEVVQFWSAFNVSTAYFGNNSATIPSKAYLIPIFLWTQAKISSIIMAIEELKAYNYDRHFD